MMEGTTDSLRALAPKWSLAGDEKLLNLLEKTHQKMISKCQEVNTKLNEMASALDDASINLQNVNNKFMALSNSQFVESRVYDDDGDVTANTKPLEEPQTQELVDEVTLLKRSLAILDFAHETAEILDESDSDDSDAEISVVLKPKDPYALRPLPFIIGSQAWKNKWHAGLVIEESDSDSDTSKHDLRELEQYSESEDEVQTGKHVPDTTISESSSSFHSEREKDLSSVPDRKQTPADIAAELAARLGRAPPRMFEEPEAILPQPTPKPVYRPQKPVSSTIYSDEPPPLDPTFEHSSDSQDEDDIFAEINKKQPYNNSNTAQNRLADDLFGRSDYSDFSKESKSVKQKSTLFDEESEPELFVEKPTSTKESSQNRNFGNGDNNTKKPVGGISLFGSNKGTENIGAAILSRNRRKSTPSDNESGGSSTKNTLENDTAANEDDEEDNTNNANYIFDNLFAKAKQAEQKTMKPVVIDRPVNQNKPKTEVKDLFSDNIFDDIDDIFTSNIKIPTKEANKNTKSIFDDDDDDLFSDIAKKPQGIPKSKDTKATSSSSNKKSIFDSDDDLFSDVKVTGEVSTGSEKDKPNKSVESESRISKSSVLPKASTESNNNDTTTSKQPTKSIISQNIDVRESIVTPKTKIKSIFDSDSDDELFSDKNKTKIYKSQENTKSKDTKTETELVEEKKGTTTVGTLKTEKAKVFHSPSLFEEDEIDDLFINANKVKIANVTPEKTFIEHVIPEDIPDFKNNLDEEISVKGETSNIVEENKPKELVNKNPVILDTKPYVFPKIDELEDNLFTKHKDSKSVNIPENIKDDFIETSQEPTKVQHKSSSIDVAIKSKSLETVKTDITTDNNKEKNSATSESLIPETLEPNTNDRNRIILPQESDVSIFDKAPVKEKQDVIPEQKIAIPIAASFDDIFSEPPAFEKTKETKKTTNVNALFEDDSDDEALFFKKNDVISDEKPNIFSPSANFGLFNDEPPALVEVDFTPPTKHDFFSDDDDLFASIPSKEVNASNITRNEPPGIDEWNNSPKDDQLKAQTTKKPTQELLTDDLESNLFSSLEMPKSTAKLKPITKAPSKVIPDSDEELFNNMPVPGSSQKENTLKPEFETKISTDKLDEISSYTKKETDKKIGKLNTKNFNINVQALIPGASPKKIPKERSDDAITNTNDNNFLNTSKHIKETTEDNEVSITEVDNAKLKEVKDISFESKPESGVLDNKLSKQRAKIQVKRRPSSRRARHEAVRKSVIDIDDDTDNSSSFDEPVPKTLNQKRPEKESNEDTNQDKAPKTSIADQKLEDKSNMQIHQKAVQIENLSEHKTDTNDVHNDSIKKDIFNIHDEITKDKSLDEIDTKNPLNIDRNEIGEELKIPVKSSLEHDEEVKSPQSTTKVVYILNDEDIFSNKTEKPNHEVDLTITKESDDDDLFKDKGIKSIENTTLVYKETNIETAKKDTDFKPAKKEAISFFDLSDDDDELFGRSTKTKKVEVKSKLFDSDSEDDLFSGKKKDREVKKNVKEVKKNVKEVKKVTAVGNTKKSLFSDDDDDLFGVKTKTVLESSKVSISTSSRSTTKDAAKPSEIVFDDPLSMLDDD